MALVCALERLCLGFCSDTGVCHQIKGDPKLLCLFSCVDSAYTQPDRAMGVLLDSVLLRNVKGWISTRPIVLLIHDLKGTLDSHLTP